MNPTVGFAPIVSTFSGTQHAYLANNTKRFGNGRTNFSTSTRYPAGATFNGAAKQNLWWSPANKAAAAAAYAAQKRSNKSRKTSRRNRRLTRRRR